jgi:hypothetical protein
LFINLLLNIIFSHSLLLIIFNYIQFFIITTKNLNLFINSFSVSTQSFFLNLNKNFYTTSKKILFNYYFLHNHILANLVPNPFQIIHLKSYKNPSNFSNQLNSITMFLKDKMKIFHQKISQHHLTRLLHQNSHIFIFLLKYIKKN